MDRRNVLTAFALLPIAGCATMSADLTGVASTVNKVAATVVTDFAAANNLYGIAKGVGQVALAVLTVSNPAAAAIVTAGIALVDPIIAKITAGTALATTDVSTILTQSQAILVAAAPAITAVAHTI